ncbi:MAG: DUF4062 domain-containing protein [Phycisphaerales bacterium]|nr:DUF4062 domain-containing protein [Phycisphaerales bacterium]
MAHQGPTVFICYAKRDSAKADEIYQHLRAAGVSVWMDRHSLFLGDNWKEEIRKAVINADVFVVLLSKGFDEAGFRQTELRWAIKALETRPPNSCFIIPFIIEPISLPEWCQPIHAGVDLSRPTSFEELILALEKQIGVGLHNVKKSVEPPPSRLEELLEYVRSRENATVFEIKDGDKHGVLITMCSDNDVRTRLYRMLAEEFGQDEPAVSIVIGNPPAQHVPVFVGSTYEDLREYRDAVQKALHRLETIVRGMEYFGSKPGSPKEECLRVVRTCKVYIGIFAMRYGSIDDETGKSMTHLEFEEAERLGLPSLIYLVDESRQPVLPKFVETGEKAEKLRKLKEELKKRFTVSFYTTPQDLAKRISQDLPPVLRDTGLTVND